MNRVAVERWLNRLIQETTTMDTITETLALIGALLIGALIGILIGYIYDKLNP